jgi:hypothetical protein
MVNGIDRPATAFDEEAEKVINHLTEAYNHHNSLPDQAKAESWRLESLRAYARESRLHQETKSRLEAAKQEIEQLKMQMERLSNCQQPRELTLYPPATIPLPTGALRHLTSAASDGAGVAADWDYDRLLTKWKGVVVGTRRPTVSAEVVSLPTPVEGVAAAEFSTPHYPLPVNGFTPANAASPGPNGATPTYNTADAVGEDAPADDHPAPVGARQQQQQREQQPARVMPQAVMLAESKARAAPPAAGQTQRSDEGQLELDVRTKASVAGKHGEARKGEATTAG